MHTPCFSGGERSAGRVWGWLWVTDSSGQVPQCQKDSASLPAWLPGKGAAPREQSCCFPITLERRPLWWALTLLWEISSLGSWQLLPAANALLYLCFWKSSASSKYLLGWNARLVLQLPPKAFQVLFSCLLNLWSEACPSLHTSPCFPSWSLTLQISYIMHNVTRNSCSL